MHAFRNHTAALVIALLTAATVAAADPDKDKQDHPRGNGRHGQQPQQQQQQQRQQQPQQPQAQPQPQQQRWRPDRPQVPQQQGGVAPEWRGGHGRRGGQFPPQQPGQGPRVWQGQQRPNSPPQQPQQQQQQWQDRRHGWRDRQPMPRVQQPVPDRQGDWRDRRSRVYTPPSAPAPAPQASHDWTRDRRGVTGTQQREVWQRYRTQNWRGMHRTWVQRGGYTGYRVPAYRFRMYFGRRHVFHVYSYPVRFYRSYPEFRIQGFWVALLEPVPEWWAPDWYETDEVYVVELDDGYYLADTSYPEDLVAISFSID